MDTSFEASPWSVIPAHTSSITQARIKLSIDSVVQLLPHYWTIELLMSPRACCVLYLLLGVHDPFRVHDPQRDTVFYCARPVRNSFCL